MSDISKREELKKLKIIKRMEELREKGFSEKRIKRLIELDGQYEEDKVPLKYDTIPKKYREGGRYGIGEELSLEELKERRKERNRQYQLKNKEVLKEKRRTKRLKEREEGDPIFLQHQKDKQKEYQKQYQLKKKVELLHSDVIKEKGRIKRLKEKSLSSDNPLLDFELSRWICSECERLKESFDFTTILDDNDTKPVYQKDGFICSICGEKKYFLITH